jgi:hypothetical protein
MKKNYATVVILFSFYAGKLNAQDLPAGKR